MSTALFLIVFVAFVAQLFKSAAAIRNAWIAIALTVLAIGSYVALSVPRWVPSIVLSALMLALGIGVPTLLANAETKSRGARMAAFFVGVLTAMVAADVWRITGGLPMPFYATPHVWFSIGAACFLIFKARFFEDVLET